MAGKIETITDTKPENRFVSMPLIFISATTKLIFYLHLVKKFLKYVFLTNILVTYLNRKTQDFLNLPKLQTVQNVTDCFLMKFSYCVFLGSQLHFAL